MAAHWRGERNNSRPFGTGAAGHRGVGASARLAGLRLSDKFGRRNDHCHRLFWGWCKGSDRVRPHLDPLPQGEETAVGCRGLAEGRGGNTVADFSGFVGLTGASTFAVPAVGRRPAERCRRAAGSGLPALPGTAAGRTSWKSTCFLKESTLETWTVTWVAQFDDAAGAAANEMAARPVEDVEVVLDGGERHQAAHAQARARPQRSRNCGRR